MKPEFQYTITVDKAPRAGLFWMTGSQQFQLMAGVSETPAGRVGIINLPGLSHWETLGEGEKSTPFPPLSHNVC